MPGPLQSAGEAEEKAGVLAVKKFEVECSDFIQIINNFIQSLSEVLQNTVDIAVAKIHMDPPVKELLFPWGEWF